MHMDSYASTRVDCGFMCHGTPRRGNRRCHSWDGELVNFGRGFVRCSATPAATRSLGSGRDPPTRKLYISYQIL